MFLPIKEPLTEYKSKAKSLSRITNISHQLPKLLLTGKVQKTIDQLKNNVLSVSVLLKQNDVREIKLAMSQISFISHAYIWGSKNPSNVLPESL